MRATPEKMCQLFLALMRGNARPWFDALRPRSVTSYDHLCDKFLIAFNSLRKIKKTHNDLQKIKQGMKEKLSTNITHFSREAREVDQISDEGVLVALHIGLTHKEFWDHLRKFPVKTLNEALVPARPFIKSTDVPEVTSLPPTVLEKRAREPQQYERSRFDRDRDREHYKIHRIYVISTTPKKKARFDSYR